MTKRLCLLASFLTSFSFAIFYPPLNKAETLPYQKNSAGANHFFGAPIAGVGDINGDGAADLVASPPETAVAGIDIGQTAVTFSKMTGVLLRRNFLSTGRPGPVASGQPAIAAVCSSFALLHQKDGNHPVFNLGYSVANAGDLNHDGREDFIASAPWFGKERLDSSGSILAFSGRDGSLLYHITGTPDDRLGWATTGAGDVNRDGFADFIVSALTADPPSGAPNAGSVYVYSGRNRSLLWRINGSPNSYFNSVAGPGDVNADGWDDFIIGDCTDSPGGIGLAGSVSVYSGRDRSLLYKINGATPGDIFGFSVSGAGDVNADGRADFIVGAPSGFYSPTMMGQIFVYSGKDGSLIFQKKSESETLDEFGMAVAGAGDVNGDGFEDVVVGAPFFGAGAVFLYSGADGSLLFKKEGLPGFSDSGRFGLSVDGAGDTDGDGIGDFIVGNPGAGQNVQGSVFVYSGTDGRLLFRKNGLSTPEGEGLGWSVAGKGDFNADGRADIIVSAPGNNPRELYNAGTVYIYGLAMHEAVQGDLNCDGFLTVYDVVALLTVLFLTPDQPPSLVSGDVNCDGMVQLNDIVYELNAVFLNLAFPCVP